MPSSVNKQITPLEVEKITPSQLLLANSLFLCNYNEMLPVAPFPMPPYRSLMSMLVELSSLCLSRKYSESYLNSPYSRKLPPHPRTYSMHNVKHAPFSLSKKRISNKHKKNTKKCFMFMSEYNPQKLFLKMYKFIVQYTTRQKDSAHSPPSHASIPFTPSHCHPLSVHATYPHGVLCITSALRNRSSHLFPLVPS